MCQLDISGILSLASNIVHNSQYLKMPVSEKVDNISQAKTALGENSANISVLPNYCIKMKIFSYICPNHTAKF